MEIQNIIINSKLIANYLLVENFIKQSFVFLNGIVCLNPLLQIYKNDFIQLILSIKYYIFTKYIINTFCKKKIKMKKIAFYKMQAIGNNKQRSNHFPNTLLKENFDDKDISKFLEIDFFTLSIFILFEPFFLRDITYSNFNNTRFNVINLYN
jgi:hypothetical protein